MRQKQNENNNNNSHEVVKNKDMMTIIMNIGFSK